MSRYILNEGYALRGGKDCRLRCGIPIPIRPNSSIRKATVLSMRSTERMTSMKLRFRSGSEICCVI